MPYRITFLPAAERELSKLPKAIQKSIGEKIKSLAENPRPPQSKLLRHLERYYRIRVGDYRIIYRIEDRDLIALIIRVGHRSKVSRGLRQRREGN